MPVSADRRLTSGHARTVRAAFVGALTTGLGVGAHEAAGGAAPSLPALGAITVGVGALAWLLSGQRWTPRTLLAAFLLTQGAVHGVSMVQHPDLGGDGALMLLTHGLAAALLVAVVPRAERALLSILDHLALRALRIRRVLAPAPRAALLVSTTSSLHGVARIALPLGRAPPASV